MSEQRWRIAADEKPAEDSEYIVGRRGELFGGWQLDFDYFSVEAGAFASDEDGEEPPVLVWMPCPPFPDVCAEDGCNDLAVYRRPAVCERHACVVMPMLCSCPPNECRAEHGPHHRCKFQNRV